MTIKKISAVLALLPALAWAQPPGAGSPQARIDNFMNRLDTNKDGKVEKAEFLKPFEMQFDMMDGNHDGALTRDEINKFQEMMRQRMEQMRQRMQQGGQR